MAQAAEAHAERLLVEEGEGVAVARREHDGVHRRPGHGLAAPVDAQPAVGAEARAEGHVRHRLAGVRLRLRVRVRLRLRLRVRVRVRVRARVRVRVRVLARLRPALGVPAES